MPWSKPLKNFQKPNAQVRIGLFSLPELLELAGGVVWYGKKAMTDQKLLHRLKVWRAQQARKEGVEPYRVLPNSTLEEIARTLPLVPEDFFRIKGIKEGRWMKYGGMLLPMVRDAAGTEETTSFVEEKTVFIEKEESLAIRKAQKTSARVKRSEEAVASLFDEQSAVNTTLEENEIEEVSLSSARTLYTVSSFLEAINVLLSAMTVRVKGEVSSVDKRDRVVYFSIKDQQDESLLNCLIFRYHYDISGVALEVGQEIIVEGTPEIYKPNGRFSLKVQSIELSGEGALKKAYDELRAKLEFEGVFAPERKRALPILPERIALITSNQGAAIGDFMMNLGKYGFTVRLLNSSVEGKRAVFELIEAVRFFNRHPEEYDVLVIIRGGGSLESLQAFNSEVLVREIAASKIPVLAGIGHEKDVSLAALAADVMVSTPTATARELCESWQKAENSLGQYAYALLSNYERLLLGIRRSLEVKAKSLTGFLEGLHERFTGVRRRLIRHAEGIGFALRGHKERVARAGVLLLRGQSVWYEQSVQKLLSLEGKLRASDPRRILRLGYSLVVKQGRLIRSAEQLLSGESVDVRLSSGSFEAKIEKVKRSKQEG